eukprot:GILK01008327.1.p1 GENE.GILK01008327.1~~GILK01008327.1.p1  ORF type:complete len:666 (-),score=102.00 GILK01008327.1:285-2282(-)
MHGHHNLIEPGMEWSVQDKRDHTNRLRETLEKFSETLSQTYSNRRAAQWGHKTQVVDELQDAYEQLEERERELRMAAEIGQVLLEKNRETTEILDQTVSKLRVAETEADDLRHEMALVKQELQESRNNLIAKDRRYEVARQALEEAEASVTRLTEQNAEMDKKLKRCLCGRWGRSSSTLMEDISQTESSSPDEAVQKLRDEKRILKKEMISSQGLLEATEKKLLAAETEIQRLQDELSSLKSALNQQHGMNQQMEQIVSERQALSDSWREEKERLQASCEQLTLTNQQLINEVEEERLLREASLKQLDSMKQELKTLQHQHPPASPSIFVELQSELASSIEPNVKTPIKDSPFVPSPEQPPRRTLSSELAEVSTATLAAPASAPPPAPASGPVEVMTPPSRKKSIIASSVPPLRLANGAPDAPVPSAPSAQTVDAFSTPRSKGDAGDSAQPKSAAPAKVVLTPLSPTRHPLFGAATPEPTAAVRAQPLTVSAVRQSTPLKAKMASPGSAYVVSVATSTPMTIVTTSQPVARALSPAQTRTTNTYSSPAVSTYSHTRSATASSPAASLASFASPSLSDLPADDVTPRRTEKRKDASEEFFALTCLAVKLNSPYMEQLCTVDTKTLYEKVVEQRIPFHKWYDWIRVQLTREYVHRLYQNEQMALFAM